MRRGLWLLILLLVVVTASPHARAEGTPVLHEQIPFDPADELSLSLAVGGGLRPAIQTPSGLVPAPNAERPLGPGDSPYGPEHAAEQGFEPDRNTRRPDVLPYDDPFSPSTAPFKRMSAFDAVDASYKLYVRDPHTVQMAVDASPALGEAQFYADIVVDLVAGQKVRVPSVGPGAHPLRIRAGIGSQDLRVFLHRDGAENWFLESDTTAKARVVMELAVPRAAFGGDFGAPSWAELAAVPLLPPNAMRSAAEVFQKIGISRRMSPHDDVAKMVTYFRGFVDSDDPPRGRRDIYLDLALSKKGVCRHRAFAFLVTSLALGIPTRLVTNEAHAWVEVYDGRSWRRIDLGGAGRALHDPLSQNVPYEAPPDPFAWPQNSTRGEDLADRARRIPPASTTGSAQAPPSSSSSSRASGTSGGGDPNAPSGSGLGALPNRNGPRDERPQSALTMTVIGDDAHRGAPLQVRGTVAAEGGPCGHVTVEILLQGKNSELPIGILATDERGAYDGALVLPATVPLGDYDVVARTTGDARCGRGGTR